MHIAAMITCHNRRAQTLECLRSLFKCELPPGITLSVVLVDDGSTDGTSEAVAKCFPTVKLSQGNGSLFWNRGMQLAHELAETGHPDYFLWLNDDVVLFPDALVNLFRTFLDCQDEERSILVVGSTRGPSGAFPTYGGAVSASRLRRFTYSKVWDPNRPRKCEVINGNVVLVPREIEVQLGGVDPHFEHAMGDTDFALRAIKRGFQPMVAPGFVGICQANPEVDFYSHSMTMGERWRMFIGRKSLPPKSWHRFTKRHGGVLWVIYFIQPYARFWTRTLANELRRRTATLFQR